MFSWDTSSPHVRTLMHAHMHTDTQMHTCVHTMHTHAHTNVHMHTRHTNAHVHTGTHPHTHLFSLCKGLLTAPSMHPFHPFFLLCLLQP